MQDKLMLFVEVAVTVMAFSSIIFQVKTTSDPSFNAYAFKGILIHSFLALLSSCITLVLVEIITSEQLVVHMVGGMLGLLTFLQAIAVWKADQKSAMPAKIMLLTMATLVFVLQALSLFSLVDYSGGYFLTAVLFHIVMSLVLFMVMIFQEVGK